MPVLSIPFSFTPGTVIASGQVNSDFNAIATFVNSTKLDSTNIQTGGVSTANIADAAITTIKLADGSVTTAKIVDANVTLAKLASDVKPRSEVWICNSTGYGIVNTKIRRYIDIIKNIGTDITYATSSNDGASFTINTDGVYSVHIEDFNTGTGAVAGASLNSTQLTTGISSNSVPNILIYGNSGTATGAQITGSVTFNASAGDVIRPHDEGTNSGAALAMIRVTRVSL